MAKTASKTTAVAKSPATTMKAAAASNANTALMDPALLAEMAADTGSGFEEATKDAYAIPFLSILQDLSPQTKKSKAEFVEGAKPGMFYHSITKELLEEVTLIPCYYSQTQIEWIPRDKGGGFVAAHPGNTPLVQQATRDGGKNILPNGHELSDTRQHFCLLLREDGTADEVLVALKSTQLKYSRRWMTQQRAALIEVDGRLITPPAFAWAYRFGSVEESNDDGTWYSWDLRDRTRVTDANTYRRAKAFNATMKAGAVKVNYDELQSAGHEARGEGREPGSRGDLDNDIPGDM